MADERDSKVSAAYRALGAEEPPRALDEAILAAARRPRISPARAWTQRWAVPLSLAAVVVLSVAVTLHLQLEQPGIDGLEAPQTATQAVPQAHAPEPQPLKLKAEEQLKLAAKPQARQEARRAEPKAFTDARSGRAPAAAAGPAAAQAPAPPLAASGNLASRGDSGSGADTRYADSALRREEERVARDAEAAARAPQVGAALAKRSAPAPAATPAPAAMPAQAAKLAAETPEHELERIAQLRTEGRHDEADKALAEFRKRYPEFRIPEETLKRLERR